MFILPSIIVDLCGNDFLLPYLERVFPFGPSKDQDMQIPIKGGVRIYTEDTLNNKDVNFDTYCEERHLPIVNLHCPYIIGTGMQGLTRRLAQGIYNGRFLKIKGNLAKISIIHATDIAKAAKLSLGKNFTATLTDGHEHLISDLVDALAFRIDDKRLFEISPRWAKWWYGKKYFDILTNDHLHWDTFRQDFPEFTPENTIQYLKTHVYDEESL